MKKIFLTLIFTYFFTINSYCYDLPENIKIGLYFGNNAKENIILFCENGFAILKEKDYNTKEIFKINNALSIEIKNDKSYHNIIGSSFNTYDEALQKCLDLEKKGITPFPALINNEFFVACGAYNSENEATTDALIIKQKINENNIKIYSYNLNSIIVTKENKGLFLYDTTSENLVISPLDNSKIKINEKEYRGMALFKNNDNYSFNVINYVNLEQYLYSVVSKEMSPSFPLEALKAQAVCARTYAVSNYNKYIKQGFNLCNTTQSQVYEGVISEHTNTTKAVDDTKGQILTYNDKPISSVFFATSGGFTEDSKYVWGGEVYYLKSVEDKYEPKRANKATWSVSLSKYEISKILADKGVNIGEIKDIKIIETTSTGRVTRLEVIGTTATKIYTLEGTRTFLSGKLYSQLYTIKKPNSFFVQTKTEKSSFSIINVKVKSASGIFTLNNDTTLFVKALNSISSLNKSSDNFVFEGKGYGHGVGLSQWGAVGMAENGFLYEDILKHYYTGVTLNK